MIPYPHPEQIRLNNGDHHLDRVAKLLNMLPAYEKGTYGCSGCSFFSIRPISTMV